AKPLPPRHPLRRRDEHPPLERILPAPARLSPPGGRARLYRDAHVLLPEAAHARDPQLPRPSPHAGELPDAPPPRGTHPTIRIAVGGGPLSARGRSSP